MTFEVVNTGTHRVEINTSLFNNVNLQNAVDATEETNKVTIEVGGRVTISGETLSSTITLLANAVDGISSVKVRGSAVLSDNVGMKVILFMSIQKRQKLNFLISYEAECFCNKNRY